MADGIRSTTPGALTFPVLRRNVTEIALVSEDEIASAVRLLALRAKLVVEPTGAVGAAAVLAGKLHLPRGSRVGVVLSGGNIDPPLLARLLLENGGPRHGPPSPPTLGSAPGNPGRSSILRAGS